MSTVSTVSIWEIIIPAIAVYAVVGLFTRSMWLGLWLWLPVGLLTRTLQAGAQAIMRLRSRRLSRRILRVSVRKWLTQRVVDAYLAKLALRAQRAFEHQVDLEAAIKAVPARYRGILDGMLPFADNAVAYRKRAFWDAHGLAEAAGFVVWPNLINHLPDVNDAVV